MINIKFDILQVILGIILPPLILLLDFRIGDDASYQGHGDKDEGKDKDDDAKSSKVPVQGDIFDLVADHVKVYSKKLNIVALGSQR